MRNNTDIKNQYKTSTALHIYYNSASLEAQTERKKHEIYESALNIWTSFWMTDPVWWITDTMQENVNYDKWDVHKIAEYRDCELLSQS